MHDILFFDSTLRDGSHAIRHQLKKETIIDYCKSIDTTGLYTVIVGHGNGLGASSIQVGMSLITDIEMLKVARDNLRATKLGIYLLPGFGTIKDDLKPAIDVGVEVFCVGSHCTEADTTKQHIEFLVENNLEVYGALMNYHMTTTERLVEEALKMESYGVNGILIFDSAGASTPSLVKTTINALKRSLKVKIGFHAHNNLGMAVANTFIALNEGASIVDGTVRGFGAGAGNCQLEALIGLLIKEGAKLDVDFYKILDASENVIKPILLSEKGISPLNIVSGMAGVFSGFETKVLIAAKQFDIDPRDIFIELGKRKVVGGQEDLIIEVAKKIKDGINEDKLIYQIETLT